MFDKSTVLMVFFSKSNQLQRCVTAEIFRIITLTTRFSIFFFPL